LRLSQTAAWFLPSGIMPGCSLLRTFLAIFTIAFVFGLSATSVHADSERRHAGPAKHAAACSVVDEACSLRGTRYRMGGVSRSGFDCSGFVRYILGNAGGVNLPRTALEQYYQGASIALNALKPGDLVFFRNTYRRGISHVGIYIGNGQFIHAANPREGVRLDSLNESYYASHFAGARRVIERQ
jgi:cell wall-associated NlpC family hydrolase